MGIDWTLSVDRVGGRAHPAAHLVIAADPRYVEEYRHELAHVLTDQRLQGAPLWMHEGVAVWASRSGPAADQTPASGGSVAVSCPSDAELRKASSADALRRMYEQAVRCYANELAAGRSWRTWVRPVN